jgi:hypothetical protein
VVSFNGSFLQIVAAMKIVFRLDGLPKRENNALIKNKYQYYVNTAIDFIEQQK